MQKKDGQVRSSCAFAYAYVVALTSQNGVDISTSISTRPWTNHRSLWPRPHANISKAIWRTLRPPSCLSWGCGELVSRIESNMPFCACVCSYAYAYALVKTRLYLEAFLKQDSWLFKLLQSADTCNNFCFAFYVWRQQLLRHLCPTSLFFKETNASSLNIFHNINSCINLVVHALNSPLKLCDAFWTNFLFLIV